MAESMLRNRCIVERSIRTLLYLLDEFEHLKSRSLISKHHRGHLLHVFCNTCCFFSEFHVDGDFLKKKEMAARLEIIQHELRTVESL